MNLFCLTKNLKKNNNNNNFNDLIRLYVIVCKEKNYIIVLCICANKFLYGYINFFSFIFLHCIYIFAYHALYVSFLIDLQDTTSKNKRFCNL